jgi:integrase/recombinase XerD
MTVLASYISDFLRHWLPVDRGASEHTCDSYAYAFQLLFAFASKRLRVAPSQLGLEQIDAPLVLAFLQDLEKTRSNGASSRNVRLAAIKSFMRYIEHRVPAALDQAQRVLAIPSKKTDSRLVCYLQREEMQALLDAPDPSTRDGIRDRAMLHLAFAAGLRVSELVGLRMDDLVPGQRMSIRVLGKGRRQRVLPLWKETTAALRAWLSVRGNAAVPEFFTSARGQHLTRAGFEYILEKHVAVAVTKCPSIGKKRVSPHVLRHTCAMLTLHGTGDLRKVSLWLGHASMQTTEVYTRADPNEKLDAINAVTPPGLRRGRFRPPDKLMAALSHKTPQDNAEPQRRRDPTNKRLKRSSSA